MTVPDYTNWYPKRPNTAVSNVDDCMLYGGTTYLNFWGDISCTGMAHGVCKAQPQFLVAIITIQYILCGETDCAMWNYEKRIATESKFPFSLCVS